jgi:hypothetical protein
MQPNENTKKPFFARLLEAQDAENPQAEQPEGRQDATLKYPSDSDEWPF